MSWHNKCYNFDSRIESSADDVNFNDARFLLTQEDASSVSGDKVSANKAILALISPVFYEQFYGNYFHGFDRKPIKIVEGTAKGFKQMIKFICNPLSFQLKVDHAREVFDISYFAHKYQIGSLVSLCRSFLGNCAFEDNGSFKKEDSLDILQWALSNPDLQKDFPAEHALLVHDCLIQIESYFKDIFKDGEIHDNQSLPNEDLMMKILANKSLFVDEGFVLSVALNYFVKLLENESGDSNTQKKLKIDEDAVWNEKLDKITTVVKLEKVCPSKLSDIVEKLQNKIPPKIVFIIIKKVSTGWKAKNSFEETIRTNSLNSSPFFEFYIGPHGVDVSTYSTSKEINIKFTVNKNAIFKLKYPHDDVKSVSFQNENEYQEVFTIEEDFEKNFLAKENSVVTIRFEKLKDNNEEGMWRVEKFNYYHKDFHFKILELNGEKVANNSTFYSMLSTFLFSPI